MRGADVSAWTLPLLSEQVLNLKLDCRSTALFHAASVQNAKANARREQVFVRVHPPRKRRRPPPPESDSVTFTYPLKLQFGQYHIQLACSHIADVLIGTRVCAERPFHELLAYREHKQTRWGSRLECRQVNESLVLVQENGHTVLWLCGGSF